MSEEQRAEELVEEGLKLYSQGILDEALDKWRAAQTDAVAETVED